MKTTLLMFALLASTPMAYASTICGDLSQEAVRPICKAGEMCPHNVRMEQVLRNGAGKKIILQTSSLDV